MADQRKPVRLERSIIRRSSEDPRLAEGERTLIELDPNDVTRMLKQARGLIGDLERLFGRRPRRRRR